MKTITFKPCLLAVLITSILSSTTYAATSDDTLVVSAAADGATSLPAYTNSATKSAVPESKTPQVINSVGSQEIAQRHANSLNEILRYAPGVSTETRGSTSYMSEYKIRGFSVDNAFYDGLQLPYNVTGNTKANIDPILIDHVDILKGPASVLYGNGSPGGLVNIQGKKPQREQKTEVGFNSGSRNLREGYIDSTGAIADSDWSYRFIGKASAGNDQPHTTKSENYLLAPSLTWQPSDQTRLTIDGQYQDIPSLTPSNPYPIAYLRSGHASRRDYSGDNWSGFKQRQWSIGYSFEHQFDSGWGFAQKARYFDVDTHQHSIYATGTMTQTADSINLDRFAYTTDENLHSFNIDNQLTKQVDLGDVKNHLMVGIDHQRLNSHFNYQYATNTPGIDMLHPDYQQVNESALGLYTAQKNRLSYNQTGYYFQDQIEYDKLSLIAGLRYDDYRSTSTNYLSNNDKTWVDQHRVTKRLGALYTFDSGIAPFISYSEGFLPVSPAGNLTSTKPTTSRQLEGGVKYLLADYATTVTASMFHIRQKNVLTSDINYLDYRQTGEVTSKGAELSLESRPTENITLLANYAYTHAINTRDDKYQGKRPTQVAENAFNLWGDYAFSNSALRGLTVGGGARYVGPMEISLANDQGKLGGTTQFDMAVSYNMAAVDAQLSGVTLKLSAQNLTNKETFTCYDTNSCWIGRDRTWQAGVSYTF